MHYLFNSEHFTLCTCRLQNLQKWQFWSTLLIRSGEILQALSDAEHWAEVEYDVILTLKILQFVDKTYGRPMSRSPSEPGGEGWQSQVLGPRQHFETARNEQKLTFDEVHFVFFFG